MGKFVSVRISSCRITSVSFDQEVPNMVNHQEVSKKKKKKNINTRRRKSPDRLCRASFLFISYLF